MSLTSDLIRFGFTYVQYLKRTAWFRADERSQSNERELRIVPSASETPPAAEGFSANGLTAGGSGGSGD
jgi:hypothetical protein